MLRPGHHHTISEAGLVQLAANSVLGGVSEQFVFQSGSFLPLSSLCVDDGACGFGSSTYTALRMPDFESGDN